MKNTPARGPRSAPRRRTATEARETATSRFEFARRHILTLQKLEAKQEAAIDAIYAWKNRDEDGEWNVDIRIQRKPKTPEEREELKALENALVDARARILLHENDGREL